MAFDCYGLDEKHVISMVKDMAAHAVMNVMSDDSHFGLGAKAYSWTPENCDIKVTVQVSVVNKNLLFYKTEGGDK